MFSWNYLFREECLVPRLRLVRNILLDLLTIHFFFYLTKKTEMSRIGVQFNVNDQGNRDYLKSRVTERLRLLSLNIYKELNHSFFFSYCSSLLERN